MVRRRHWSLDSLHAVFSDHASRRICLCSLFSRTSVIASTSIATCLAPFYRTLLCSNHPLRSLETHPILEPDPADLLSPHLHYWSSLLPAFGNQSSAAILVLCT